jgi:hypothetical protein
MRQPGGTEASRLPAFHWLWIRDGSRAAVATKSGVATFFMAHGRKLTYLESPARLGTLFRYCTNVVKWSASCNGGIVSNQELSITEPFLTVSKVGGPDFGCLQTKNLDRKPGIEYALETIGVSSFEFGCVKLLWILHSCSGFVVFLPHSPEDCRALIDMDLSRLTKLTSIHLTRIEWPKSQ